MKIRVLTESGCGLTKQEANDKLKKLKKNYCTRVKIMILF